MNEELSELVDVLTYLDPAPGVIGIYWNSAGKCWRIQLDNEDFLREFEFWDEEKEPGNKYPYELSVSYGPVEVFCLVRELPE